MLSPAPDTDSDSLKLDISQEISSTSSLDLSSQNGFEKHDDIDLAGFQKHRVNTETFPLEILGEIFQWLDIRSLDAVGLVSRKWHQFIANDSVWRSVFVRTYGTWSFGRVTSTLSWKTDLIERYSCLRNWKKSAGATHITFKTPLFNISSICMDFPAMRLIAFSHQMELGLVADPSKGKVATPMLKTNGLTHNIEPISSVSISRFGVIYGFTSGHVSGLFFSKGTTVRTFVNFYGTHDGAVLCTWISKDVSPRNTAIGVITASLLGTVVVWDAAKGNKLQEFCLDTGDGNDYIVYLNSDARDMIIMGTTGGSVYLWERESNEITKIGSCIDSPSYFLYECDFSGGYVVASNGPTLIRHKITSNVNALETVKFSHPFMNEEGEQKFISLSVDNSPYINVNENSAPKLVPGGNARYIIALGSNSHCFVWNIRDSPNGTGVIPLIHLVETPFQPPATMTGISINSVVFAVSSNLGMVFVYNVLTGKKLQLASVRFPRRILDYVDNAFPSIPPNSYYYDPYHLELDPDPSCPQGIIVLNSAVQYFDYGIDTSKSKVKQKGIKKKMPGKRSLHHSGPGTPRNEELLKEIDDDHLIMREVNRDLAAERRHRTPYVGEGLTEEEQLSYALMLSQEAGSANDKDVEEAIKLSLQQQDSGEGSYDFSDEYEDDSLYNPTAGSSSQQTRLSRPSDMSDEDWELQQAMSMSLQETEPSPTIDVTSDDSYDEDLELALKLSMLDTSS